MEGIVRETTKIKICGITREEEISWLNEAGVDYAGFVFYEKSKRFISIEEAQRISKKLNSNIKKVAVTVSPERELIRQIGQAGFDILQIHGAFEQDMICDTGLTLWRAVNLSGMEEIRRWRFSPEDGIDGILFDAGDFGSGKTFGWETKKTAESCQDPMESAEESGEKRQAEKEMTWKSVFSGFRTELAEQKKQFILAGGLHPENVAEGIALFSPDVVDVSSGVEEIRDGRIGKSKEKIEAFVRAVKNEEIAGSQESSIF